MRKKKQVDFIHLLNSDKNILEILEQSNKYLEANKELSEKIDKSVWIFRSLTDLVPETLWNIGSGHIFPLGEAEYELESSIQFCKLGFYKHALIALRNVLELGLLSVYWDVDGKSHINIQKWLASGEPTPFRRVVFEKLKTHPNVKRFDDKHKIFSETANLYERLCNYAHTKGLRHSSQALSKSNINTFNEGSLRKWLEFLTEATRTVVAFHILKYPVALQHTPIDEKFGLNGPIGGFLQAGQTERIKKFFSQEIFATLQEISDNDEEVKSLTEQINAMPNITEEEFLKQVEEHDKEQMKGWGYERWLKNERKLYQYLKKNKPQEYAQKQKYFKKMRKWAKENNLLKIPSGF